MNRPLISVILPVCDGAAGLERAIRSVQVQTFGNWELLAVDQASGDGACEALERWAKQARKGDITDFRGERGRNGNSG